jgi:hypothetical protein
MKDAELSPMHPPDPTRARFGLVPTNGQSRKVFAAVSKRSSRGTFYVVLHASHSTSRKYTTDPTKDAFPNPDTPYRVPVQNRSSIPY